jgi:hypothetical protein
MFHEAAVNLPDVIVGTPCPDRASPDRKQVKIHYCAMNPNGNHPFAEELVHCSDLELPAAKDCQPLVWIGAEPQAGETVAVESVHRLLGALLNDCDVRIERQ